MKTVSGSVISSKSISLSKAASILNSFMSFDNGASHDLSAYLKRTSASVNGLVQFHGDLKCGKAKKTKLEMIDNEGRGIKEEGRKSERKKKNRRTDFSEVEERENEGHTDRKKKKKKVVEEMGELDDTEEMHRKSKKRKH